MEQDVDIHFIFHYLVKTLQIKHRSNELYVKAAEFMAAMCIFIIMYNQSMREDAAFLIFFMLAAPYVCLKTRHKNQT